MYKERRGASFEDSQAVTLLLCLVFTIAALSSGVFFFTDCLPCSVREDFEVRFREVLRSFSGVLCVGGANKVGEKLPRS